jgi:hypothetical protein
VDLVPILNPSTYPGLRYRAAPIGKNQNAHGVLA